jgi:hypothetical protein
LDRRGVIDHPELGLVKYEITPAPGNSDSQVESTIQLMRRYVAEDALTPEIQRDAMLAIQASVGLSPAESVFWWVKGQIRFVEDDYTARQFQARTVEPVVEALIRPRDMAALIQSGRAQGDCDDFAMYTAALLMALTIPVAFVTVAGNPGSADYSHVYVAAYTPKGRLAMDTSHGPAPGWEYQQSVASPVRIQEWPISTSVPSFTSMAFTLLTLWSLWHTIRHQKIARQLEALCKFQS